MLFMQRNSLNYFCLGFCSFGLFVLMWSHYVAQAHHKLKILSQLPGARIIGLCHCAWLLIEGKFKLRRKLQNITKSSTNSLYNFTHFNY